MKTKDVVKIEKKNLTFVWYMSALFGMLVTCFLPTFFVYYPAFLLFMGAFMMNGRYSI